MQKLLRFKKHNNLLPLADDIERGCFSFQTERHCTMPCPGECVMTEWTDWNECYLSREDFYVGSFLKLENPLDFFNNYRKNRVDYTYWLLRGYPTPSENKFHSFYFLYILFIHLL